MIRRRTPTVLAAIVVVALTTTLLGTLSPPVRAAPADGLNRVVFDGDLSASPLSLSRLDAPVSAPDHGTSLRPPIGGTFTVGTFTADDVGGTTPTYSRHNCVPTAPAVIDILQVEHTGGELDRFAARVRSECTSGTHTDVFAWHATVGVPAIFVAGTGPATAVRYLGERTTFRLGIGNTGTTTLHPSWGVIGSPVPGLTFGLGDCPAALPPQGLCTLTAEWVAVDRGVREVRFGVTSEASTFPGDAPRAIAADPVVRLEAWDLPPDGEGFEPIAPTRLLDTRFGIGASVGALGQSPITVRIAGRDGIPAEATGVLANVTVTEPTGSGFLTLWPSGTEMPLVSNLNFVPGETAPNTSLLALGPDGAVQLFNSAGRSHVVIDVVGWLSPYGDLVYRSLTFPSRLADTRGPGSSGPLGPGAVREFEPIHRELPATAVAVLVNVTGTEPTAATHLTVFGGRLGAFAPNASTLNLVPGQTRANVSVVDIADLDRILVRNNSGSTHVVIDLIGWFERPSDPSSVSGRIVPLEPFRASDTRLTTGERFGPGEAGGYRYPRGIGNRGLEVSDIVFNTTVTEPTAPGFLTVFPWDLTYQPYVSTLNFVAGQTVPNQAWARLAPAPDNYVGIWNGSSGSTHVVMDIQAVVLA